MFFMNPPYNAQIHKFSPLSCVLSGISASRASGTVSGTGSCWLDGMTGSSKIMDMLGFENCDMNKKHDHRLIHRQNDDLPLDFGVPCFQTNPLGSDVGIERLLPHFLGILCNQEIHGYKSMAKRSRKIG